MDAAGLMLMPPLSKVTPLPLTIGLRHKKKSRHENRNSAYSHFSSTTFQISKESMTINQ